MAGTRRTSRRGESRRPERQQKTRGRNQRDERFGDNDNDSGGGNSSGTERVSRRPQGGGRNGDRGRQTKRGSGARRTKKEQGSWFANYFIWILIMAPIGFGLSMCDKSEDNSSIKNDMFEIVETFPNYNQHKSYYRKLVNQNHDAAFEASYTIGRRSNGFDEDVYWRNILRAMLSDARRDGKDEVAKCIMIVEKEYE